VYLSVVDFKNTLQFAPQDITVSYRAGRRTIEFWSRSLMSWAQNIVEDPYLASLCEWDAMWLEKFDGETWVPFFHEPWSATRMWDIQVSKC
jgi:hypothetical protein